MDRKSDVIFLGWFLGFCFGLPLALFVIRSLTGVDLSSAAVTIMPMMLAVSA